MIRPVSNRFVPNAPNVPIRMFGLSAQVAHSPLSACFCCFSGFLLDRNGSVFGLKRSRYGPFGPFGPKPKNGLSVQPNAGTARNFALWTDWTGSRVLPRVGARPRVRARVIKIQKLINKAVQSVQEGLSACFFSFPTDRLDRNGPVFGQKRPCFGQKRRWSRL